MIPAQKKRRRIPSADRAPLANALRRAYEAGATVRSLATDNGSSYGLTHALLAEAGTQFRPRGGRSR